MVAPWIHLEIAMLRDLTLSRTQCCLIYVVTSKIGTLVSAAKANSHRYLLDGPPRNTHGFKPLSSPHIWSAHAVPTFTRWNWEYHIIYEFAHYLLHLLHHEASNEQKWEPKFHSRLLVGHIAPMYWKTFVFFTNHYDMLRTIIHKQTAATAQKQDGKM